MFGRAAAAARAAIPAAAPTPSNNSRRSSVLDKCFSRPFYDRL
jgi:hypothetical protein